MRYSNPWRYQGAALFHRSIWDLGYYEGANARLEQVDRRLRAKGTRDAVAAELQRRDGKPLPLDVVYLDYADRALAIVRAMVAA